MAWSLNESTGSSFPFKIYSPKLRLFQTGLQVFPGDVIIPSEWTNGTNSSAPGSGGISAYHCSVGGILGSAPGANWPSASEDVTVTSGSATLRAKNLYHLDPSAPGNGNGSQVYPANVVGSVSGSNGRVILIRRGTSVASALTGCSGNIGNFTYAWTTWYAKNDEDLTLPKPKCAITHTNAGAVIYDGILSDGNGTGNGFSVIHGSGSTIFRVFFRNCDARDVRNTTSNNNGFMINSVDATGLAASSLIYDSCTAVNCGGYGFGIESGITSENSKDNIVFYRCKARNNGHSKVSWGFGGYARFTTNFGTSWNRVGAAGTFIYSFSEASTIARLKVHGGTNFYPLTKNTADPTNPGVQEWGQSGGVLYVNLGVSPGTTLGSGYTFWRSYTFLDGVRFIECEASEQHSTDGSGFGADTLVGNWIFERCWSHDNDGEGFVSNIAEGTIFRSNLSERDCFTKRTTNGAIVLNNGFNLQVTNNTILDSYSRGIYGINDHGTSTIKNNKILRSLGTAVDSTYFGGGGNDISDNSTSDAVTTGTYIEGSVDFYRKKFVNPPTVGCIQTQAAKTLTTRTLTTRTLASSSRRVHERIGVAGV